MERKTEMKPTETKVEVKPVQAVKKVIPSRYVEPSCFADCDVTANLKT